MCRLPIIGKPRGPGGCFRQVLRWRRWVDHQRAARKMHRAAHVRRHIFLGILGTWGMRVFFPLGGLGVILFVWVWCGLGWVYSGVC